MLLSYYYDNQLALSHRKCSKIQCSFTKETNLGQSTMSKLWLFMLCVPWHAWKKHVHQLNKAQKTPFTSFLISFIFDFLSEHCNSQELSKVAALCQKGSSKYNSIQHSLIYVVRLTQWVTSGTSKRKIFFKFMPNNFESLKTPCCAENAQHAGQYWHRNANMAL